MSGLVQPYGQNRTGPWGRLGVFLPVRAAAWNTGTAAGSQAKVYFRGAASRGTVVSGLQKYQELVFK